MLSVSSGVGGTIPGELDGRYVRIGPNPFGKAGKGHHWFLGDGMVHGVRLKDGKAEWYRKVRRSFGTRTEAMREELDAIPREGEGQLLPLAWIESVANDNYMVQRWEAPPSQAGAPDFPYWSGERRKASMLAWLVLDASR